MKKKVPTEVLLKEYAKLGLGHLHNRCSQCGRRLKLKPGSVLGGHPERFWTCRSCGFENPTLMSKVADSLESQGYDISSSEGVLDLPQCFGCGTELQVSRDFTKVFCMKCGSAWDRYVIEDILNYALSPSLAGQIPLKVKETIEFMELETLLAHTQIDSSTPFHVIRVFPLDGSNDGNLTQLESMNKVSALATVVKEELIAQWTMPIKMARKLTKSKTINVEDLKANSLYLAVYEDYLALYSWDGRNISVEEAPYSELFSDAAAPLAIPFKVATKTRADYQEFMEYWAQFWVIYRANLEPFKEVLFGEKAKAESQKLANFEESDGAKSLNISTELTKLAELHAKGILTDEEFRNAKSKILS